MSSEKKKELFQKTRNKLYESGLFTKNAIEAFMSMLAKADEFVDVDLITMFLLRDGMERHSFGIVNNFVKTLPLKEISSAA